MCNNIYNLHIECVINNDDTYIAYVFPETDTEQLQKQTSFQHSSFREIFNYTPIFPVFILHFLQSLDNF